MCGKTLQLLLFLLLVSLCYSYATGGGGRKPRIASGEAARSGENLDYALLTVVFQNQMQVCGGVFIDPRYILTIASCVHDVKEGPASVVNVTFPVMKAMMTKFRVFIHEAYDPLTYANNIAIVKMMNITVPDGKTLMYARLSENAATDAFLNQQVRVCGYGSIANYYTKPNSMMCTSLFVQPADQCSSHPNTICTFWTDRDNNVCANDYGSPIYTYVYAGSTAIQTVIGLASYSPDYKRNAPCYDGHRVVHTQVGAYTEWIDATLDKMSIGDPAP